MTDQTIAGPGVAPLTPQDIADRERRILVQGCFKEDNPALTRQLMLVHNVSVQEIQTAMDYKVDVIKWMRMHDFPDVFQGGKFDRFSRTTGYKAVIQARTNGNISGNPIKLAPSALFLGTGVPSLAYIYTNTGAKFSDEIGAFAAAGVTTWTDAGVGFGYPLLRKSTVSDVYGDTAYFVSAIQPRRLSIQMTRYVVPATLTPVGTNQTINVTGAGKVLVSPAAAASINIATFTNTTGVVSDSGRNGDLIIEAGNGNLTIVHNVLGTGSQAFFLAGGANVTMGAGQLKRFCYSSTANMWIEA